VVADLEIFHRNDWDQYFRVFISYWNPDLADLAAYQKIDLILLNGVGYAKWVILEGDPARASVAALDDLGVGSLVFDPDATVPQQGDFMVVMQRNVENLRKTFSS
jgi:hypothetical protein